MVGWNAFPDGRQENTMTKTAFVIAPSQPDTDRRKMLHYRSLERPKGARIFLGHSPSGTGGDNQLHALRGISEIYILRQGEDC